MRIGIDSVIEIEKIYRCIRQHNGSKYIILQLPQLPHDVYVVSR